MRKRIVLGKIGQVRENVLARSLFARKNLSPETPGRKLRQKSEGDTTRGAVRSTDNLSFVTLDDSIRFWLTRRGRQHVAEEVQPSPYLQRIPVKGIFVRRRFGVEEILSNVAHLTDTDNCTYSEKILPPSDKVSDP